MQLNAMLAHLEHGDDRERAQLARVGRASHEAAERNKARGRDFARAAFYGALWGAAFAVAEERDAEAT